MKCNCSVGNTILGLIILVVALFPALLGDQISKWIIVIASVLLIIHELWHKHKFNDMKGTDNIPARSSRRKKR